MNKNFIGWIVAAVLAVGLGGVLIYNAVDDGGGRTAALGSGPQGQGQGPPAEVAQEVAKILEEKNKSGKDTLPQVGAGQNAGQNPTRLDSNPRGDCDPSLSPNVFPEWRNDPQNLSQAKGQADEIVVGTVTGIGQGQSLVAAAPGEPGGQVETPVQKITIRVDEAVKGSARAGGVVTIEKLGDAEGCYRVAGDPPYQQGEQYLLLLESGKGGRSAAHAIAPAGRLQVIEGNFLRLTEDNPFVSEVAGQKLEQVLARLRG